MIEIESIWKFPIQIVNTQSVIMPYGSKILCVQTQGEQACLWAQVKVADTMSDRTIDIFGTGHDIADLFTRTYIGTIQQFGGRLVWHVFERHT